MGKVTTDYPVVIAVIKATQTVIDWFNEIEPIFLKFSYPSWMPS